MTAFGARTVGPEVNEQHTMILFVPGIMPQPFTDPSYHLPAFYELWARWGPPEDRAFWAHAAEVSRAFFVKTTNPKTGLAPDYANFDGTPHANRFPQSGIFGYDAWRTASNWSVDWSWWKKAPQERELSNTIQAFFAQQGMADYWSALYARRQARRRDVRKSRRRRMPPAWLQPMPSQALQQPTNRWHGNLSKRCGSRIFRPEAIVITTACCIS